MNCSIDCCEIPHYLELYARSFTFCFTVDILMYRMHIEFPRTC